jgi:UDPglucose 6-dehydrogenase
MDMTLKDLRIHKGLTQIEASRICNIPLRTYKRIESSVTYLNNPKYQYAFELLDKYVVNKNNECSFNSALVIGAGYVGLSISVLLSQYLDVTVIDINKDKVDCVNNREPIFKDKDIEDYFKNKRLSLTAYLPNKELYRDKDVIIIAIPTDFNKETGLLDTNSISNLVKEIRTNNNHSLIVIKSTCYVGFTDSLNDKNVIFSPEFLREGHALHDNLYPSRIIIGGDKNNKKVKEYAKLMQSCSLNRAKTLYMSPKEAEAVKLFSNTYLAMRVAYFNELDSFAMNHDIDAKSIIEGVSLDPRIGDYYNNPSFGYGGYCLPKDTDSLITQMKSISNSELISSISHSNQSRKEMIANDIINRLNGYGVVGVYSIQSKKDSDNKRYAAILDIVSLLKDRNINVIYYQPHEMSLDDFKKQSDIILVNRYHPSLDDVKEKVYTRDLFLRD